MNTYDGYEKMITPKVACTYSIRTTFVKEHSRGIFWTADILNSDGVKIGSIEQLGDGGADQAFIDAEHEPSWSAWLKEAYPEENVFGAEECASAWMLYAEEERFGLRAMRRATVNTLALMRKV
jgi:hypothetical protein